MSHKEHLSRISWSLAHKRGYRLLTSDPDGSLAPGNSLLARKLLANHLEGPILEETTSGLVQEDVLSKEALLCAKWAADSKSNSKV